MDNLVSGLIGAVIASLLTAAYLWISDVRKLRGETFVETAGFFDQVWQNIQNVHAMIDLKNQYDTHGYPTQDVMKAVQTQFERITEDRRTLLNLINSTQQRAKIAFAYGEGVEMALFNVIVSALRKLLLEWLWVPKSDWPAKSAQIHEIMARELDPARASLERRLMAGCQAVVILREAPVRAIRSLRRPPDQKPPPVA